MRQVLIGVVGIGQLKLRQIWLHTLDDLWLRQHVIEQGTAQAGKTHLAPAGDHMVGKLCDLLTLDFVADFRTTQHHPELGAHCLEQTQQLGGCRHVPDVHTKANNGGWPRHTWGRITQHPQQVGQNLLRRTGYCVFTQYGLVTQTRTPVRIQVGQQITQPKRGMDVAGVKRAQHNAWPGP